MAYDLFQDVILTIDLPERGLCAGDLGTIVEHHIVPGREDGDSVELFDLTGRTVAFVTLPPHNLRTPTSLDRPSVRTPGASALA